MRRLLVLLFLLPALAAADARVVDGDTIDLGDARIRLHGIDAPELGQSCAALGEIWRCGEAAADRLGRLIRGKRVTCETRDVDRYGREIAVCRVGGVDIGAEMVRSGLAWAFTRFSGDYVGEEDAARAAQRGIWRAPNQPAWEYRAEKWRAAEAEAPAGCPIKGNISANGRIYHTPWSPWYARTRIDPSKGERWFCDEAEARAAGWRAPR